MPRGGMGTGGVSSSTPAATQTAHDKRGARRKSKRRRKRGGRELLAIKNADMVKKAGY